ncbi:hypothetical protein P7C71_g3093, partial [Lecanoromycetidae sp. Uapishka_2]
MSSSRPPSRQHFTIALICALSKEFDAVRALFDRDWEAGDYPKYDIPKHDENSYAMGRIGVHDVVLTLMPNMGKRSAATSSTDLRSSFSGIILGLLVGICGGAPSQGPGKKEIILGDVICKNKEDKVCDIALSTSCDALGCDPSKQIRRLRHDSPQTTKPFVHFGVVASGDSVVKSAHHRDDLIRNIEAIGFEMEGAGVWDKFPTVIIKGVADYADSHKAISGKSKEVDEAYILLNQHNSETMEVDLKAAGKILAQVREKREVLDTNLFRRIYFGLMIVEKELSCFKGSDLVQRIGHVSQAESYNFELSKQATFTVGDRHQLRLEEQILMGIKARLQRKHEGDDSRAQEKEAIRGIDIAMKELETGNNEMYRDYVKYMAFWRHKFSED